MGRKTGTEVGVNSCLVALIATESPVSIALSWLLLPPEVGVSRPGQKFLNATMYREAGAHILTRNVHIPYYSSASTDFLSQVQSQRTALSTRKCMLENWLPLGLTMGRLK